MTTDTTAPPEGAPRRGNSWGGDHDGGEGVPTRYRHQNLILAICCLSLFIVSLDVTIVNVALPSLGKELKAGVTSLQWTLDAYTLVLASLLVLSGSFGDRFGRRRIFQLGLVIFTTGSLLCSLAPSVGWLIAARMLQAVGGSMLNPVALSIVTTTFTDKVKRARAVGVWGAVVGLSFGLGPFVGGVLVETVGWRSIFYVNIPIGIAAILLTAFFVPESHGGRTRKLDPVGQVLIILTLAGAVFGLIEGPELGWGSPGTIAAFVVAAAALTGFIVYERRIEQPLIDVRFFKSAPFSIAIVTALIAFGAWGAFLFVNTLYLQESRGFSPIIAGLCTAPAGLVILILSPVSGRMTGARGPRLPMTIAGIGIAIAAGLLVVAVTATTPVGWLVAVFVLFGAGFALVNSPITNTAVSGMPNAQAGAAAAIASTGRQVGSAFGIAIAGSITGASGGGKIGAGFAEATHPLWYVIVVAALLIAAFGSLTSSTWAKRSAERVAPLLGT